MAHSGDTGDQQALLDAQRQLWHHTLGYVKSMALKTALDLGIPDAIDRLGGAATLPEIAAAVALHPSKVPCLRRLMRALTVTGIFAVQRPADAAADADGEPVYGITPASRLLVGSSSALNVSPFLALMLDTVFVSTFLGFGQWFRLGMPDPTPFKLAHGRDIWDLADQDARFGTLFDNGMVADSGFLMDIVVKECSYVFQGIGSLLDVAGGLGGAAQTIAKAFPHVKCSVMDRPHVIATAPAETSVTYIAGDMFESIPPTETIFLKWVLHDWGDAECIKILKNCKKAIPSKEEGGKVIILDMVIGAGSSDQRHVETQVLFDFFIMFLHGAEREEQEWKKIIFEAGFSDYKIIPVLGVRSIIEVYP